jgi:predicted phage terminase large subunit-like protein
LLDRAEAETVGGLAIEHPVAFTRLMKPDYRPAGLHWAIGDALQGVEQERIDRLMIFVPPQHGKSALASVHFPAWYLGRHPQRSIIATSYGAQLALEFGRQARNIVQTAEYRAIFPDTVISAEGSGAADRWTIAGGDGGYHCAGVGGPISGYGAHCLLIDDVIKDAAEADSPVYREAVWQWYQNVAYPRRRPPGAIILIMTRWHEDDLAGRLLKAQAEEPRADKWRVLRLPAMAEDGDPLGRAVGAPLWPDRYDLEWLENTKVNIGYRAWAALYQQSPRRQEGNLFRREWFGFVGALPKVATYCRYWDLATGSAKGSDPDWTAGCLLARDREGRTYIADVRRTRGTPAEQHNLMQMLAATDPQGTHIRVEEEKGAAGKQLTDTFSRGLFQGYNFLGDPVSGSKELRASPLAAQAEMGHVYLLRAPWNEAFLEELEAFPNATHKDQVDAASGAYMTLSLKLGKPRSGSKPEVYRGLRMA